MYGLELQTSGQSYGPKWRSRVIGHSWNGFIKVLSGTSICLLTVCFEFRSAFWIHISQLERRVAYLSQPFGPWNCKRLRWARSKSIPIIHHFTMKLRWLFHIGLKWGIQHLISWNQSLFLRLWEVRKQRYNKTTLYCMIIIQINQGSKHNSRWCGWWLTSVLTDDHRGLTFCRTTTHVDFDCWLWSLQFQNKLEIPTVSPPTPSVFPLLSFPSLSYCTLLFSFPWPWVTFQCYSIYQRESVSGSLG